MYFVLCRFPFSDLDTFCTAFIDLIVYQLDSGFDGLRSRALQCRIERGVNAIRLVVHLALRKLTDQRVADEINEIWRVTGLDVRRRQLQWGRLGLFILFFGYGMGINHAVEHYVAPFCGALRVAVWRKITRALDDSSQQSGFRQRNVYEIFIEIGP